MAGHVCWVTAMLSALQGKNQLTDSHAVVEGSRETHTSMSPQATLCIEQALHVTLPSSDTAAASAADGAAPVTKDTPGLLVAFEWRSVAYTTPAVALSHAGSATWRYQVALPVAEVGSDCGRELEPAHLHLQVGDTANHKTLKNEERKEVWGRASNRWLGRKAQGFRYLK